MMAGHVGCPDWGSRSESRYGDTRDSVTRTGAYIGEDGGYGACDSCFHTPWFTSETSDESQ